MGNPGHSAAFDSQNRAIRPPSRRTASIGILTYKRPEELHRCLEAVIDALDGPMPGSWSVVEIVVIDNDPAGSALPVVSGIAAAMVSSVPIRSVHEPIPGVAEARNRALSEAVGDVLVFIDDDEIPSDAWPHGLLTVLDETGAAMVGGPVLSEFTSTPPQWIIEGRFFERDDPAHQSQQGWLRSGNLAIDLAQINAAGLRFDPRYRQGEDSAFTRGARAAGLDLRWSTTGAITEFVGAERFTPRWQLRREYASHRAWTRTSLDLATGPLDRALARVRTTFVAVVRAVQGMTQFGSGLVAGRRERQVDGLATVAGAAGKVVEIVAYRQP